MRLLRQRGVLGPQHCQWHTPVSGRVFKRFWRDRHTKNQRIALRRRSSRPRRARRASSSPHSFTSLVSLEETQLQRKLASTISQSLSSLVYVQIGLHISLLTLTSHQPSGAEKAHNILGDISEDEKKLLVACKTGLKGNIEKGVEFVHNPPPK